MELPVWSWSQPASQLAIDVAEEESAYIVKASIPGIKVDDLDVTIT